LGRDTHRPLRAVQRPSSLNASGLIVDGRSSTLSGRPAFSKADIALNDGGRCGNIQVSARLGRSRITERGSADNRVG
jgi:hypothetical protein